MTQRTPNCALQGLFAESGWTLDQCARAVNRVGTEVSRRLRYNESAVHHWLGGTLPREPVRRIILEAFSRRLNRPVTHAQAGFPVPAGQTSEFVGTVEGLVELGSMDVDPSRRGLLGAGLFSVALTIPGWQDVVARAEGIQTGASAHIGMNDVRMVIAMTERLSELDDEFGGRYARPLAASFLINTVVPALGAGGSDEVRKAMRSAASDLCYLAGYMAVDEGEQHLAQRYYVKALELAGAANDPLTYSTTLRGMSVQAVDLGHGAEAMRLADAAAAASPEVGPRMRAFLAGQQAHAAAQTGDRAGALSHIREAEVAMEKAESRAQTFRSYDPASLQYHVSQVRYELGDRAGAVKALEESDRVRLSVFRRSRVHRRGLLAERQLQLGHLEAACHTWNLALDDYPSVKSGRADDRMRRMAAFIRPYRKNAAARALYERARPLLKV
ncbi:transcriptional regulator [Streptomyces sp. WAC 06783]|uniref:tetratricopeptide repeat protein n=1 Tax=Streptomyces sp. WAC 06783 TaxID=2203211 RepID=UPI000F7420E2|nr:tetratricopeptide repeat protein [Streptomyces sp. WAC 06783]RSO12218.1 transcriptional regulator [Streptomyces sp. WAC 06783]